MIQTAFLGDAVLTTPLLEILAKEHGPVDVVTTPQAMPLFETLPSVERIIGFDKRGVHRGLRGIRLTARALEMRKVRYAYLPHESIRSALIAWLAGIEHRIGYITSSARWMYTEKRRPTGEHAIHRMCSLTDNIGVVPEPHLALTPTDRAEAEIALTGAEVDEKFAVLAPGSRQATKRWPYYAALAERLSKTVDVVLLGDESDAASVRRIVPNEHRVANLAGRLSIRASAAVIQRAHVVVCNDSVSLHIAGAMKTPVVAVFGPTTPALGFGPRGSQDITLGVRHLPCRPCSTHGGKRCPLQHHKCMVDLHVDTVAEATLTLLKTIEADSPCA